MRHWKLCLLATAVAVLAIACVDQKTVEENERGDSAHVEYKDRQHAHVRARLES